MNYSFPEDLSVSKTSDQYKMSDSCRTCAAINAVDRDNNTCTRVADIGTTSTEKRTWWRVDLGGRYNVYNIRIQFKDYEGYSK